MNADLTPAFVALGGGSALLAAIGTKEHLRDQGMRKERVRLALRFPIGLESPQAMAALDGLSGLPYTTELVAEVVATEGAIAHFVWVPMSVSASVQSTMTGVIPSLRVTGTGGDDASIVWAASSPSTYPSVNIFEPTTMAGAEYAFASRPTHNSVASNAALMRRLQHRVKCAER